MKLPITMRTFTAAVLASALAAPLAGFAQDGDPEQAEQRRAEERAARRAEQGVQRAEQAAARAMEQAAREAQEAQRRVEVERAQVAPRIRLQPGQDPINVLRFRQGNVETKPQAYLGVSTRQLTADVAAHVGEIPEGVGLIVSFVDEEGPAGKAGLQEHDVLVKIDDQWLINPQQFSVLVRMHKAGDEATLTVFRKGEEQEIEVELIEKELPVLQPLGMNEFQLAPLAMPEIPAMPGVEGALRPDMFFRENLDLMDAARREEIEARVQEAMKQLEQQLQGQNIPEIEEHMQQLRQTLQNRQLDMERLRRDMAQPELLQRGLTRGGRLFINNEDMTLSMVNNDGEISIEVSDADGEELYEGPFPTAEQLEELPENVRAIIEQARKYLPEAGARDPEEDEDEDEEDDDDEREQVPGVQDPRVQRVRA